MPTKCQTVCSLFQMSVPLGWRVLKCAYELLYYWAKRYNNLLLCLARPDKETLLPRWRWADGQPIFFLFDLLTFFFPSLQSLKQNLQDEVMHNGVKRELFTSLTRRERLRAQTKDGFWTIKLGLSIFGISRKTQCGAQSRRQRDFKRLLCRRPQACSFGNKAITCHFPYLLKQKFVKLLRSSTFLEGKFRRKIQNWKKKMKKGWGYNKALCPSAKTNIFEGTRTKQRSADINSFKFSNSSSYCHWDKGWNKLIRGGLNIAWVDRVFVPLHFCCSGESIDPGRKKKTPQMPPPPPSPSFHKESSQCLPTRLFAPRLSMSINSVAE